MGNGWAFGRAVSSSVSSDEYIVPLEIFASSLAFDFVPFRIGDREGNSAGRRLAGLFEPPSREPCEDVAGVSSEGDFGTCFLLRSTGPLSTSLDGARFDPWEVCEDVLASGGLDRRFFFDAASLLLSLWADEDTSMGKGAFTGFDRTLGLTFELLVSVSGIGNSAGLALAFPFSSLTNEGELRSIARLVPREATRPA